MIDLETYRMRLQFAPVLQSILLRKKRSHQQHHVSTSKKTQKSRKTPPMNSRTSQKQKATKSETPHCCMYSTTKWPNITDINRTMFCLLFWMLSVQTIYTMLVIGGMEVNPGPVFGEEFMQKTVHTVGHCHQANISVTHHDVFGCMCIPYSYTQGVQCVANSLCAVALTQLKDIRTWLPYDLDTILCSGDKLYKSISGTPRYLEMADIPRQIHVYQETFTVVQLPSAVTAVQASAIQPALEELSSTHLSHAILFLGNRTGAYASSLHLCHQQYFIFDPHARSPETGFPHPDGKSIVIKFPNSVSCALYIKHLAKELHAEQLNICPVQLNQVQVR